VLVSRGGGIGGGAALGESIDNLLLGGCCGGRGGTARGVAVGGRGGGPTGPGRLGDRIAGGVSSVVVLSPKLDSLACDFNASL